MVLPISNQGKSVKWFMSYDRTYKQTDNRRLQLFTLFVYESLNIKIFICVSGLSSLLGVVLVIGGILVCILFKDFLENMIRDQIPLRNNFYQNHNC